MSDEKETPKSTESQEAPETREGETPAAPEAAPKKEVESFRKEVIKKKDEAVKKVESEIEEKYMKKSRPQVSQRALGKWKDIMRREKLEIHHKYVGTIKKFEGVSATSTQSREALAKELLAEADKEANLRMTMLKALIESKKKGEYVTTEEVAEIDKALSGLDDFEKRNPHLQQIFIKIIEKGTLERKDYEAIVTVLNPHDIARAGAASAGTFEATAAGILIGAMTARQREELVLVFRESGKRSQMPQLIDALVSMGLLTEEQAETLVAGTPYAERIRTKIRSGQYKQERAKFEQEKEKHFQKYRGIYAENINNRFWFQKPFWGVLAMVWGTATFAVNALVARRKGEKNPLKWLGRMSKNPYAWAGVAAVAGGAELTGTSLKQPGAWFGAGPVSRLVSSLGEKEKEPVKPEENARAALAAIRETGPAPLRDYLEFGGFATIKALVDKMKRENKKRAVNIDELLQMEQDPAQKQRLTALKSTPGYTTEALNQKLTQVVIAAEVLKLDSNKKFVETFQKINKKDAAV